MQSVIILVNRPFIPIPGQKLFASSLYSRVSFRSFRACSHEHGSVNYPGVMIALGQALPRVHMMICCPRTTLPRVNFIAPGQVHRHLITKSLSEFL